MPMLRQWARHPHKSLTLRYPVVILDRPGKPAHRATPDPLGLLRIVCLCTGAALHVAPLPTVTVGRLLRLGGWKSARARE
jgi:hypothetical protein